MGKKQRVTITLYHSRKYDPDNLSASVKPVLDAMKHWQIILDDAPRWVELEVRQEKYKHRARHTIIEIEPAGK
jgi:Holliday junction resolvase RusA-like endonuclease